jgi:phosphotransferase system enzyme I (PtsI)
MEVLKGLPVSPGIRIGPAIVRHSSTARTQGGPRQSAEAELARLESALDSTRDQLRALVDRLDSDATRAQAKIFQGHQAMLADPTLRGALRDAIAGGRSAREAVETTAEALATQFRALHNAYLSERAADIEDVARRVAANLDEQIDSAAAQAPGVLFAKSVTPSQVALLDPERTPAIVTEEGGRTSHAAILARALRIAAVSGIANANVIVHDGDPVIVDGEAGELILRPDAGTLERYRRRALEEHGLDQSLSAASNLPALTLDGVAVQMAANISGPDEVRGCFASGAESIGVFRTEFLYLKRDAAPSEDEQASVYREVLAAAAPRRVTIRTADLGSDKEMSDEPVEPNPALGLRGLRRSLAFELDFRAQLRALVRAASHGNLAIMLPMVTDVEEVRRTRAILVQLAEEAGTPVPPLGVMIETPAAALLAEEFASVADFFSIGTNDLAQYTLAVDRVNERVSSLYQPLHPAVIRLVRHVAEVASRRGVPVAVCGEIAADPLAVPLLLGMGIGELSMNPVSIPAIKAAIRRLRHAELKALADETASLGSAAGITEKMHRWLRERTSDECIRERS